MNKNSTHCAPVLLAAALVAMSLCERAHAAAGDILNLGTLGGTSSYAFGINTGGTVVGSAFIAGDASSHAFKHPGNAGGVMQDLGTLGGRHSEARGINDGGAVVGYAHTANNDARRAFKHPGTAGGVMQDLGTLGGTSSEAYGINAGGAVVGRAFDRTGAYRGFKHPGTAGGAMQDLGTLGGEDSEASGINAAGAVVGYAYTANGTAHAFKHPGTVGGAMQDLGTLGGTTSIAYGINAGGVVVGSANTVNNTSHAFKHPGTAGGAMQDLGTLGGAFSSAYGINAGGAVVGWAQTTASQVVATFWKADNTAVNLDAWLNNLNATHGGYWTLTEARAVNDGGLVAGYGTYNDGSGGHSDGGRAFLLDASSLLANGGGGNWLNTTSADNDWRTGSNWLAGAAPRTVDNATFARAGAYTVAVTPDAVAADLTVSAGTVNFVTNGNALAVNMARASTGSFSVTGSGKLKTAAYLAVGNGGTATVTVDGAAIETGQQIEVGEGFNSTGTLTIQNGGTVAAANFITLATRSTSTGNINVTGPGSTLRTASDIHLGQYPNIAAGGTGTLTIGPGALVEAAGTTKVWTAGSKINLQGGTLKTGSLDTGNLRGRFFDNWTSGTLELTSTTNPVTLGANGPLGRWAFSLNAGQHLKTSYTAYVGNGSETIMLLQGGATWNANANNGSIIIATTANLDEVSTVQIDGTGSAWHVSGTNDVRIGAYGRGVLYLLNGGAFTASGNVGVGTNNTSGLGVGTGQVYLDGASSTFTVGGDLNLGSVAGTFGELVVDSGTASVAGRTSIHTGNSGIFLNGGTLKTGSLDTNGYGSRLNWTGGTLHLTGGTSNLGNVTNNRGTLTGTGTVVGNVANVGGTISPGNSAGTLNITGLLSSDEGLLALEIASLTSHDELNLTGTLTLDDTAIDLNLLSFAPSIGQSFDLLDFAGTIQGTYTFDFTDAALLPGLAWDTSSFAATGTIGVVAVPEPTALGLLALGAAALVQRRRR
jgi:probable HAF family extracellular repeat protein/T5SS/PEP-CTERM-associated repeat protein